MTTVTEGKKAVLLPKGAAIWPRLNEPDTKFNAAGLYSTKIAFDADTPGLSKIMDEVDAMIEAEYQGQRKALINSGKKALADKIKKADSPFKPEVDDETGDETGRIIVNAKMTASGVSKKTGKPWKRKPGIFDAKGNKLAKPPQIGGGSIMKMNVDFEPYFAANDKSCGVSVRLNGVQVIKLVQYGQRDAAGYGFVEEEGDDLSGMAADFEDDDVVNGADGDEDDGL